MLDEGVIVALGSDFNPNAYCFSMVIIFNMPFRAEYQTSTKHINYFKILLLKCIKHQKIFSCVTRKKDIDSSVIGFFCREKGENILFALLSGSLGHCGFIISHFFPLGE